MRKIVKSVLATLCIGACMGAYALGGGITAKAVYLDYLYYETKVELDAPPACYLHLEEEKIKNMTDWGYYNIDGDDVWYFYGDGSMSGNPEVRFVTEGTDTTVEVNGSYTFAPVEAEEITFSYRIANDGERGVDDIVTLDYIVQILASDGSYPIVNGSDVMDYVIADGNWHTITIDQYTPITNGAGTTYGDVAHLFSGFIFKMGGLEGEVTIADIVITIDGVDHTGIVEDEEESSEEISSEEASSEEVSSEELSSDEVSEITSEEVSSEVIEETSSVEEVVSEESVLEETSSEEVPQTSEAASEQEDVLSGNMMSIPTEEEIDSMIKSAVEEEVRNIIQELLSSCSSSISGGAVVGALTLAGVALLRKKKDD